MAAGVGSLTITSIPENCTIKKYVSSSWVDCSIPLIIQSSSYVSIGIFDNDGLNITKKCGLYSSDGSAFYNAGGTVEKVKDYNSAFSWYNAGYIFKVAGMDGDNKAIVRLEDSSDSIGNIPMGELTFNGVQSVTYNGTDYTKLVVDGTNYPPLPVMISFTVKHESGTVTGYQAKEGMTWAEWINSSYNTDNYIIDTDGLVKMGKRACIDKGDHCGVMSSENIIKDYMYTIATAIK